MTEQSGLTVLQEAERQCQAWLTEAEQHRSYRRPPASAAPPEVYDATLEVRGRLDRLSEIHREVIRYSGGLKAIARERAAEAQTAVDEKIRDMQKRVRRLEYEGTQERYSIARLDTLSVQQAAVRAQGVADMVATVERQVSEMYFGLRDLARELDHALKYLEWLELTAR
jgi:hypothetical protein